MQPKLHADELDIDDGLVRRLLREQFPQWAELSLEPLASSGTVNVVYRLGRGMLVRLPGVTRAADDVHREQEWLPRLTPHLPIAIPTLRERARRVRATHARGRFSTGWTATTRSRDASGHRSCSPAT
jgi:aminoglycoside phosphotransferase (APT) family kinase protein